MKSFLHVGCGHLNKSHAKGFDNDNWSEIRFDIDKNVNPDIEGTLLDMSAVETGSIDAIYSCHNIEHVFPHEVEVVLKEFLRVLNDDGMVVVLCPDLQSVAESILQDKLLDPLYESDAGPIAPIDILYGLRLDLEKGNHYMAHKCGFTYSSLLGCFIQAGFKKWIGGRKPDIYELCLVACKGEKSNEELNTLASQFLP
jgi:SAM-dependent methyltransferase